MLTKEECLALHQKNKGRICYIDDLGINDGRMILRNSEEVLHAFMSSEWDETEQAQCARLCQAINAQRSYFSP